MRRAGFLLVLLLASCDVKPPPGPVAGTGSRDPFGRGAAATFTAAIDYSGRRALVVGVTRYVSPTVGDLDGPAYDAADVAATLATRFGFDVVLSLDRPSPMKLPDGVRVEVSEVLTAQRLAGHADALRRSASPGDAVLFYFAGHGLPDRLLPGDAELPKADDPAGWRNLLPVADIAAALRAADAHHTLMILDCCFSGSALREGSPLRSALKPLGASAVRASEQENLGRVFNRRSFQVLTAGAGDETVADVAQAAAAYAALPKDLEGHSPFTGVLLQALRGLAGRPDGIVPASDLGYYVAHTLVNENRSFRAKQAPRFAALAGGEGDFLFLPTRPVLNPKLVSPLYMAGPEYAELRASASAALARFVAEQPQAAELARSAIPHVVRLLRDPQPGPRTAAAKALADLAGTGDPAASPEFAPAIAPLVELLPDAEAARALGTLSPWADGTAVDAMGRHLDALQARWEALLQKRRPPEEVAKRMAVVPPPPSAGAAPAEAMKALEARRVLAAWLDVEGARHVLDAERRHQKGREDFTRAERYLWDLGHFEARLLSARVLGFEGYGAPPSDLDVRLWPGSNEEWRARSTLESTFDVRPLWRSEADHPGWHDTIAIAANGAVVASAGADGVLHLWDASTGARIGGWEIPAGPRVMALSPDGRRLAGIINSNLVVWAVPDGRTIVHVEVSDRWPREVAWNAGSTRVAVGDSEGNVTVWDAAEGVRTTVMKGHSEEITDLVFLPDGRLVSASEDSTVIVWNGATGEAVLKVKLDRPPQALAVVGSKVVAALQTGLQEINPAHDEPRKISSEGGVGLAPHPDGRRFVVMGAGGPRLVSLADGSVEWEAEEPAPVGRQVVLAGSRVIAVAGTHLVCWDVATGNLLTPIRGHTAAVRQVAFLPGGLRFASLDDQDRLIVWKAIPPGIEWERRDAIKAFAASADGAVLFLARPKELVAVKSSDGTRLWSTHLDPGPARILVLPDGTVAAACASEIRVLDPATGVPVRSFPGDGIGGLALSADGRLLACLNRIVSLHDLSNGRRLWTRTWEVQAESLVFDVDGAWMAVGLGDGTIRRVSLVAGDELPALRVHQGAVEALAIFPDGGALASASRGEIVLWNLEAGAPDPKVRLRAVGRTSALAMSPDGKTLLVGTRDSEVWMWCTPRTRERRILRDSVAGAFQSAALDFSPDGQLLATPVPKSDEILVRDADTGRRVARLKPGTGVLSDLAWCGKARVAACGRGQGVLLDSETGREIARIQGAVAVAGSAAGRRAAFAVGGTIVVVDAESGERTAELGLSGAGGWSQVRFSGPDRVAAADGDGRLVVWSVAEDRVLHEIRVGFTRIPDFAVDPTGEWAAVVAPGDLYAIRLRRLADGSPERRVVTTDLIDDLEFSPDGRRLAAAGQGGTLRILDTDSGGERVVFALSHADVVRFRPDSGELASAGTDGLVRFWDSEARNPELSASLATHEYARGEVRSRRGVGAKLLDAPSPAMPAYLPESVAGLAARIQDPAELRRASCFTVLAQGDADGAADLARALTGEGAEDIRLAVAFDLLIGARRSLERGAWRVGHRRVAAARALGLRVDDASEPLIEAFLAGTPEKAAPHFEKALMDDDQKALLRASVAIRSGDLDGAAKIATEVVEARARWETPDFRGLILDHLAGRLTAEELLEKADQEPIVKRQARGEAQYHLGLLDKARGNPAAAKGRFEEAAKLLLPASLEGELARRELVTE